LYIYTHLSVVWISGFLKPAAAGFGLDRAFEHYIFKIITLFRFPEANVDSYKRATDDHLLMLTARGDQEAFGVLYERHKAMVYGMAFNALGERTAAENVALDAFTQLWQSAACFNPGKASVRTWLMAIVRYRSIDAIRRLRRESVHHVPSWAAGDIESLPAQVDVEDEVQTHDLSLHVQRAVAELPEDQKQPLALAFFSGYSHSQIAGKLGLPIGTVKTRIRAAMKQLRITLSKME